MINKIYNIIIYMHFAQNAIDQYLKDADRTTSDNWSLNYNHLPDHLNEYLSEKSQKYLGLDLQHIDHNKLFTIIYGTILVEDIAVLIDYFKPYLNKIRGDKNYSPEVIDNSIMPGWVTLQASIPGSDHIVRELIVTYIKLIDESEIKELIRDIQIDNILDD